MGCKRIVGFKPKREKVVVEGMKAKTEKNVVLERMEGSVKAEAK